MIYTSYYGNRFLPGRGTLVQISLTRPRGYRVDIEWKEVAPNWNLVRGLKEGSLTEEEYTKKYKEFLEGNKDSILSDFEKLARMKEVILLCYEKAGTFCHRHILADFLMQNTSEVVKELV